MDRIRTLADLTPDSRNRAVDLYRALAIVLVVLGHWVGAAVWVQDDGTLRFNNILALDEATHWLTWIVQVMPVFFIVGGYANWRSRTSNRHEGRRSATSNRHRGRPVTAWIAGRARRLVTPILPFFVVITAIAVATLALGVDEGIVRSGAWNAIVPLWFLAVYLVVIALTPLTVAIWRRIGWWSVGAGIVGAFGIDALRAASDTEWIGWVNYVVVWATVHQIGYGWATEERSPRRTVLGALIVVGGAALVVLSVFGPYPISMVAVPGAPDNNTMPPTAMMLVMACLQYGILRLAEPAARRIMSRRRPWLIVVGLHTVMMTVYIWHLTALALVVLAGYGLGVGFSLEPLTAAWWLSRPLWIALLAIVLALLVALFGPFERAVRNSSPPHTAVLVAGIAAVVVGIGAAATDSIVSSSGSIVWWIPVLVVAGGLAIGAWPDFSRRRSPVAG